jgi:hypothetical protein
MPCITHIYETIFTTFMFLKSWKVSKDIPIVKIKKPSTQEDYRPISIHSFRNVTDDFHKDCSFGLWQCYPWSSLINCILATDPSVFLSEMNSWGWRRFSKESFKAPYWAPVASHSSSTISLIFIIFSQYHNYVCGRRPNFRNSDYFS